MSYFKSVETRRSGKDPLSPCPRVDSFFAQFVRERTYLNNVTPKTREWYETAWKAFSRFQATEPPRPLMHASSRATTSNGSLRISAKAA